jgi:hypothetical protein
LPHTWRGKVAAFGVRRLIGFARGRAEHELDALRRPGPPTHVRGFIQINLIRPS